MDQNVKQVFLLQDKQVSKAVGFDIGCAPVPSIFGRLQQAGTKPANNKTLCWLQVDFIQVFNHF